MITHIVSDWLFSPCCVEHQDEFIFERVAVAYSRDYNEVGRAQIKCHKMYHFNVVATERAGKSEIREKELSQCKHQDEQIPKLSKR